VGRHPRLAHGRQSNDGENEGAAQAGDEGLHADERRSRRPGRVSDDDEKEIDMPRDVRLIRSPLSVAGMVITTVSAVVSLVVLFVDLFGLHTNPYLGIVFFLVLPALFVFGLVLIPLGAWVERRRRAAGKPPDSARWPQIDLNEPRQRTIAVIIFGLTLANIAIV